MPRILRTTRNLPKEPWTVERVTGVDGQGLPTYGSPVDFEADVVEGDVGGGRGSGAENFLFEANGSRIIVRRVLYVQGDEAEVAGEGDRVTPAGGDEAFVVAERRSYRGLRQGRGQEDHFRLRVKDA